MLRSIMCVSVQCSVDAAGGAEEDMGLMAGEPVISVRGTATTRCVEDIMESSD
jgi:hypothetical protein